MDAVLQLHHIDVHRPAGHVDRMDFAITVPEVHSGNPDNHRIHVVPWIVGDRDANRARRGRYRVRRAASAAAREQCK